jgi:hypothetical protein
MFTRVNPGLHKDFIPSYQLITSKTVIKWKKRTENQSPVVLPESPLPIRFLKGRQNLLTTKTSVKMRLSGNFHQVLYDLISDWATSGAAD